MVFIYKLDVLTDSMKCSQGCRSGVLTDCTATFRKPSPLALLSNFFVVVMVPSCKDVWFGLHGSVGMGCEWSMGRGGRGVSTRVVCLMYLVVCELACRRTPARKDYHSRAADSS
jgi:hypothetical protein